MGKDPFKELTETAERFFVLFFILGAAFGSFATLAVWGMLLAMNSR